MAIKGVARFYKSSLKHIITTQTEHKCVLDSCRALEQEGVEVTYLPVQQSGLIDLEEFKNVFLFLYLLSAPLNLFILPIYPSGYSTRQDWTCLHYGREQRDRSSAALTRDQQGMLLLSLSLSNLLR